MAISVTNAARVPAFSTAHRIIDGRRQCRNAPGGHNDAPNIAGMTVNRDSLLQMLRRLCIDVFIDRLHR